LVFIKNLGISLGVGERKKCVRPVNSIFNARWRLVNIGLVPDAPKALATTAQSSREVYRAGLIRSSDW